MVVDCQTFVTFDSEVDFCSSCPNIKTNNSSFQNDYTSRTTDTLALKPFTKIK